ncbi:Mog1p/PsbP-like protein [Delitschia confertaspora ATCC 74209]|uniref:Mog1p/PsbP-like protein n=1 Tax=Delitschia confertaspora ATCC 74209 TaxID=1513339 RepID=A0A9P4JQB5_9PLEO|nr:Mog1p/PsbP-like protein [Delitschia confertaspora ATCC 74209]
MSFHTTPLFGGAITVDLPSNFHDVSDIRQIPDNQEVYLDVNGFSSIVVDILERVEKPDDEALKVHLADVVSGTGDETSVVRQGGVELGKMSNTPASHIHFLQTPSPPTISLSSGGAVQPVNPPSGPSHRRTADFTSIHLILLRLTEQTTDIVITVNVPHYPGEYVKDELEGGVGNGGQAGSFGKTQLMKDAEEVVERILRSFEVRDFGLFN